MKGLDSPVLIAKVGKLTCAIPIELVVETMRPLPVERGVATIRGAPVIVIDLAALFAVTSAPTRFVVVRTGTRKAALAVDAVIEIRNLGTLDALPPLIASVIGEPRAIDAGLVRVLEASRLLETAA